MANGVQGTSGAGRIQRSSSNPELPTQAANEVLANLKKGLQHHMHAGDLASAQGRSNSEGGHSDAPHNPANSSAQQETFSGNPHQHATHVSPDGVSTLNVSPPEGTSLLTPVKGTSSPTIGGTSPLRRSAPVNWEMIKNEIRETLQNSFKASSWNITSAGRAGGGLFGSPISSGGASESMTPEKIVNKLVSAYHTYADDNLDLFLEAFGEVLAEKGTANPQVFHAFFQQNLGSSLFHRESMISRFSNGFEHRLKEISGLRVSNNPLSVATATTQILHANIGGGDSCIQNMGGTLVAVASSLTGDIDGEYPRIRLIQDIADILISTTNRGALSDDASGISTLLKALAQQPNLCEAIKNSPIAQTIVSEFSKELSPHLTEINISDINEPFLKALTIAVTLDQIAGTATAMTDLCSRINYDHDVDFSQATSRENLEVQKAATPLAKLIEAGRSFASEDSKVPVDMRARIELKTYLLLNASELQHNIDAAYEDKLEELQAAFTEKLATCITPPSTADRGQWQTAANSLRQLNTAFVDLYRPDEPNYTEMGDMLTRLARNVMGGYRQSVASGLQTAVSPAINGSNDAKLTEIDRRLAAHSSHQTEFNRQFAADTGPMGDVRTEQNGEIQHPIDALLTRKVEVADAKLNAAKDTVKTALRELYTVLGSEDPDAEAVAAATTRKTTVSTTITLNDGPSRQANTTSEAADVLKAQVTDIRQLKHAYTEAQGTMHVSVQRSTLGLNPTTVTADEIEARYNELSRDVDAAAGRFSTSTQENTDPLKTTVTISPLVDKAKVDIERNLNAFAAFGIQLRQSGESDATRLAYLQKEFTRLGRFLPASTLAEGNRLLASENARVAAEQSDAARAAKASTLRDISKSKDDLGPIRESLDDIRSRRPADEVRDNAAKTDVLGDRLRELPDLHQGSSELEIDAYQTAIGLYREGMMTELDILKTAQTKDLSQLTKLMGIYDGVVRQYNTEVSIPHTPSANFQNHSNALHAQGEKPQAKTMSELSTTIRADIHAIKQSRTEKSEALETANRQFATATTDLEAKLRVFYTAIVSDDTAAAVATAKATAAKTSANVDGDPYIDVQTTRMNEARGVITAETKAIGQLTGHYGTAQKAIATETRTNWAQESLSAKLQAALSTFDTQTEGMPEAERAAAKLSLQRAVDTAQRESDEAKARLDDLSTPAPAKAKPKPSVDPNIAIRSAQVATLKGVTEALANRLNDLAEHATLDDFQAALTTELQTLRDAAAEATLVPPNSKVKQVFDTLLASVSTAQGMGEVLISARPKDEKLGTLRAWQKQCQPVADSLNTIPKEWKLPLTTELKRYQALRVTKEAALRSANETLQELGATLTETLQAGGTSIGDAKAIVWQLITDALARTTDDVLTATENAIPIMGTAIEAAREKNLIAAEAAAMAIATQRLQTVTQNIRAEYSEDPNQAALVTDELTAAQGKITDRFGDGPATSESTTANAQILETRLAEIRDAKKAEALAAAQAIMATARQGVSAATAVLGERLSEWASVAGLAVPTTEMIVADMVTKLFSGRSKESLSPEELDALRQNIGLRSAAYEDITDAASGAVNAYGGVAFASGAIEEAIYGPNPVPTKPAKSIITTEKLHTVAETLRSKTLEITAATAASRIRTSDLEKLDTLKTQLGKVLDRRTDTMVDRRVLLQDAVRLLGTISTETNRLFPDAKSGDGRAPHTALNGLSRQVQTTYSRFCNMDSQDLLSQSTGTLGSVGTASSRGLDDIATGLRSGHTARRNEFETAYTIEGLSSEPRDKGLATLDGFAGQLSGAVAGRRGQLDSIRRAYVAANNQLEAAFGDAQRDIDFETVTAADLKERISEFTAACNAAMGAMEDKLRDISPDPDQPVLKQVSDKIARDQTLLKGYFTSNASGSITGSSGRLSGLTDRLSEQTSTEELNANTDTALALKARAEDLSEFLNEGLLDDVTRITNAHLLKVVSVAEIAAYAEIVAAKTGATAGLNAGTVTSYELALRISILNSSLEYAVQAFNEKTGNIPAAMKQGQSERLQELQRATPAEMATMLKATVSYPLEITRARIDALLADPATTLAQLTDQAQADTVTQLKDRLAELGQAGNNWLTDGLAEQIDRTVAAYEEKVHQLKHSEKSAITIQRVVRGNVGRVAAARAGQIRALTVALDGLIFTPPAPGTTFEAKWRDIQLQTTQQARLLENQNYTAILAEPRDRAITQALADLEARRTAAIEDRVPEQRALIAGLSVQLATLATGFDWEATLTTVETTARNALPVDLRDNAEMQAALTAAKGTLNGLQVAVRTRVTAREALATATTSLSGWPAPGRSLNGIRTEVETARRTFGNKEATMLLTEWDVATEARVTTLEQQLLASTQRRDALIGQFQAIIDTAVPTTSLADRWRAIDAQETRLTTLRDPGSAHAAMLVDPQVTAKIAEVQGVLNGHNTPTDLERAAFTAGMNIALANPALTTADAVLDRAAASVTAGLPLDSPTLIRFQTAIATLQTGAATHLTAHINSRLDYRGRITTAAEVFAAVQDRTATTLQLQTAIGTIGAVPAIVDPGDGTNIFATADAAMATQRQNIEDGLVAHTALVNAFTDAIATATRQLPTIDGTTTAQAKWTALNLANATYDEAYANADYLFGDRLSPNAFHPDIQTVDSDFETARQAVIDNVAPEATAIRHNIAADLALYLQSDANPLPVFDVARDDVLATERVPLEYRDAVKTALKNSHNANIKAEIQSRLDVHAAIQNLEADTTSSPIAKKSAIDAAKALFQNRPLNPAYAACDAILSDRLQALQRGVYGVLAEETAQELLNVTASNISVEEADAGTTANVNKLGSLSHQLELEFRKSSHTRGWKYNVGLDEALDGILANNPPPGDTNEFIAGLDRAIQSLNDQAGPNGLPEPYKGMAARALERLQNRNDGSPKLCAWVLSSNISLVLSIIESFGDTRSAEVKNMSLHGDRTQYLPLHEGITLKKEDLTSLTGRSRERGDLWGHMYGVIPDIATVSVAAIYASDIPGNKISETQFCELIHEMSLEGEYTGIASGYTPSTDATPAMLTREAWVSFCDAMGAAGDVVPFMETLWPGSHTDTTISVDILAARWKELLENETNYKHLRYLFGRKFERVYQELVIENVRDETL